MLAKIKDYGISLTQAQLPQIVVQFEVEGGQVYPWWGSLKGDAKEWTLKSLMKMGFDANTLEPLAEGVSGGALNHLQEYDIQLETKPDQNGVPRTRISWINLPGESAIRGKLEVKDALTALKGINIKGDILALKKGTGAPATKTKKVANSADPVPF